VAPSRREVEQWCSSGDLMEHGNRGYGLLQLGGAGLGRERQRRLLVWSGPERRATCKPFRA